MPRDVDQPTDPPAPADRLDSWKEIAAFLQRDVRTVQRWEKQAGLPVHRHAESRLRTAYAYRSELETWWRAQRTVIEDRPESTVDPVPSSSGRASRIAGLLTARRLVAAMVISVIALAAVMFVVLRDSEPSAGAASTAQPVVVLWTRFEDQTGNQPFASAIEETVARHTGEHRNVELVAPARVAHALRLMRREPATPITEAAGREVALRDGRIRYVLTGRIHTLQSRYFVDMRAIEPADSRVRVSVEWQGASLEQLLQRSADESKRFAALVAEAAARDAAAAEPLEQVTSASIPAVRLYTSALQAGARRQWGASELLARRAVAADAAFASAQAWVGWAMRQQGRSAGECIPVVEQAIKLASEVTDRETYLITGMSHSLAGDLPAAASAFEAVLRLHPRDRQALDLLIDVSWRSGRTKRAVDLSVARAEYYPEDFYANVRAAQALTIGRRHADRAAGFAKRAQDVASAQALADRPVWNAWLEVLPVFQHWVAGDSRAALGTLGGLEGTLADRLGRERDAFASAVGFANLAFGRIGQAERAFRYSSTPERQLNLAMLALTRGDEEGARQWLRQIRAHSALRPALFARVGLEQEAERGLETSLPSEHSEGIAAVARGLLAARRRQFDAATTALREGAQLLRSTGEFEFFLAVDALTRMALARGQIDQATRLLSDAAAERAHTYGATQWSGGYWTKLNADFVEILRRQGRHAEAELVVADLRDVVRDSDLQWQASQVVRSVRIP